MYQILNHALTKPGNKTKFKLIFANTSEKDILLKEELDALKKRYPETFDVVYTVNAAGAGWTGEAYDAILDRFTADTGLEGRVGYVTPEMIKENIAPPSLGSKVKVFVCGKKRVASSRYSTVFYSLGDPRLSRASWTDEGAQWIEAEAHGTGTTDGCAEGCRIR